MDEVNSRMNDSYTRMINDLIDDMSAACFYYANRIRDCKNAIKNSRGMPYSWKVATDKRIAFYEDIIMNRAKTLMENLEQITMQTNVERICIEQRGTRENLISLGVIKPTK
jgi:hypothetical protein